MQSLFLTLLAPVSSLSGSCTQINCYIWSVISRLGIIKLSYSLLYPNYFLIFEQLDLFSYLAMLIFLFSWGLISFPFVNKILKSASLQRRFISLVFHSFRILKTICTQINLSITTNKEADYDKWHASYKFIAYFSFSS